MSDWISIKEKLPTRRDGRCNETKVYVWAKTKAGDEKECGLHISTGIWDDSDYAPGWNVTHWKPMLECRA